MPSAAKTRGKSELGNVTLRVDRAISREAQRMADDLYEGKVAMVVRRAIRELLEREGYTTARVSPPNGEQGGEA